MTDRVSDPEYWRDRMYAAFASGEQHRLMFKGSKEQFEKTESEQKGELRVIGPRQSVIDVGCGYGRLPELLRIQGWRGSYIGYDVSPDLVEIARRWWPDLRFEVSNLAADEPPIPPFKADWAVAMWVKTMLINNGLSSSWDRIERWMHAHARNVLIIN